LTVAIELEPEDGLIWDHGLDDESVMALIAWSSSSNPQGIDAD
jgi:hypothetical protein